METGRSAILESLTKNEARLAVTQHPFFAWVSESRIERPQVAKFLGQYWYPMHYFPTFLGQLVAEAPKLEVKTAVSRILWQELGEGDPARSHEQLYIETMVAAEFEPGQFVDVPPLESTRALVDGYARAAGQYLTALGWLYGTEVNDLTIVVGLGKAVRQVSARRELPWVTIHAQQEPSHVADATSAVGQDFSAQEFDVITRAAEESWSLWAAFFGELHRAVTSSQADQARVA
jgi:pyrroloquinoline quinone (PQQ) biosynthesis protein C